MLRPLVLTAVLAVSAAACSEYDFVPDEDEVVAGDGRVGGLTGRVCGPDGEHWVVAAEVIIDHGNGHRSTGLTDGDGYFTLDDVPVGEWEVVVRKGSFEVSIPVTIVEDQVTEIPEGQCIEQGDVQIAVVEGTWDAVEHILGAMSLDYTMIPMSQQEGFMRNPARLAQYDIIFFNCTMDYDWAFTYKAEIGGNLRDFVDGGGSIYASDWAYYVVEASFPEMNTFVGEDAYPGDATTGWSGMISATVLDPAMVQRLGSSQASLNYDLPGWAVMRQTHQGDVLITGEAEFYTDAWSYDTEVATVPLVSRWLHGDGAVVYTSFHNEAQTTLDMTLLLQEIVLSL